MAICKTLQLFGSAAAKQSARNQLENLPQIKRIDMNPEGTIRLFLISFIQEEELIELLKQSGIHGYCFVSS